MACAAQLGERSSELRGSPLRRLVGGLLTVLGMGVCIGTLLVLLADAVTEDTLVLMPTRDGAHLATYIARPVGNGPFGVVMTRTPYRRINRRGGRWWASTPHPITTRCSKSSARTSASSTSARRRITYPIR